MTGSHKTLDIFSVDRILLLCPHAIMLKAIIHFLKINIGCQYVCGLIDTDDNIYNIYLLKSIDGNVSSSRNA